ncbi:MAG: DegV family protein [Clostridia bacterium]|nr:DegV family protein [Clostridia bacterium]
MIKILADSTCDLSDEVIKQYNIGIAPLTITLDDKVYKDRIDIQPDEFYRRMMSMETLPTTAMPSPTEYYNIIEAGIEEGYDEFLCICMSSGTSGAYQSATIARDYFYDNYPESTVKIHIVDSKCMSHGSGYLVLKSARLLERGATFQELVDFNETYKTNVKHFLSVDDLDNLIRSGRLTNASAMIGKLLRIKPIMSMRNGKGAIVAKERGHKKVLAHYISEFENRVDKELTTFIIIGYSSDMAVAENLKVKILNETDFKGDIFIMQMGVSVGTHVGLGGLSMFFIEKGHRHDGLIYNEMHALLKKKDEMLEMMQKYNMLNKR